MARNKPRFNSKRLKNGIQHVEKKPLEKKTWLRSEANWITLACHHCSSRDHALPRIYPVPEDLKEMKTSETRFSAGINWHNFTN